MLTTEKEKTLTCEMETSCKSPVVMIDGSGFIYCANHGHQRRFYIKCRMLTSKELEILKSGMIFVTNASNKPIQAKKNQPLY